MWSVRNPTSRGKAVRANGGLVTIKAGESVELEGGWTELELERYWASGLVIEPVAEPAPKPKAAKAAKESAG